MASGKILRQIIKAGVSGDLEAFRQASQAVINEERQKQHHLLANDLEKLLYGNAKEASPRTVFREQIPSDQERGLPLLALREPSRSLEEVVLAPDNLRAVEDLLEQYHRAEVLASYGMRPADRLLFCGPPGCGKTLTAEVIATELGRYLAIVRLDSVVSSYLGETAANLRKLFDFMESRPLVVLFDEFDALGKERADASDHGELKRVVNAVLQMLDDYRGKSLIIAATNHETMLDSAIWRRFEEVIVFGPPSNGQLIQLLQLKLRGVRRDFEIEDERILCLLCGISHADVERILRRAIKDMILTGQSFLHLRHIERARQREIERLRPVAGS